MARIRIACGVVALVLIGTACASGGGSDEGATEPTDAPTVESEDAPAASSDDGSGASQGAGATEADPPATEATAPADEAPAADTPEPAEPAEVAVAVPAALQFTAPAVGGGEIDAADYAGTPTLFWFWAPT
jgi:hypothetical protein